ncbi:MAG: leucine-rich repeat protein, partial [Alphaproteobacteria bacterium]|nr:leucine-rich repeat protein [Alphaproteobacteria bacterium]
VIPKGVISIEEQAFSSCTALADITIPDTLESVGDGVFEHQFPSF